MVFTERSTKGLVLERGLLHPVEDTEEQEGGDGTHPKLGLPTGTCTSRWSLEAVEEGHQAEEVRGGSANFKTNDFAFCTRETGASVWFYI